MQFPIILLNPRLSFRDKARLNACIAKDLSDNFGGNTVDYLRPLNLKLREEIYHYYKDVNENTVVAA